MEVVIQMVLVIIINYVCYATSAEAMQVAPSTQPRTQCKTKLVKFERKENRNRAPIERGSQSVVSRG
jgi:hypothetical protein